jgi:hypothetical protein
MKLTKEQSSEMLDAAKPLIKWLNENCHPHCEAHVSQTTVELNEVIASNITNEYLRD